METVLKHNKAWIWGPFSGPVFGSVFSAQIARQEPEFVRARKTGFFIHAGKDIQQTCAPIRGAEAHAEILGRHHNPEVTRAHLRSAEHLLLGKRSSRWQPHEFGHDAYRRRYTLLVTSTLTMKQDGGECN